MTIRAKLATAIVVAVAGLALTAGVGIWGMNSLGDKFDDVRDAGSAQALALELKYDIADFNGWQTAYGYDNGASRPVFLRSVAHFREDLATAKEELSAPAEQKLLGDMEDAFDAFMTLDAVAYRALQDDRADEVRRLFLGPEIANFQRAASAAEPSASASTRKAAPCGTPPGNEGAAAASAPPSRNSRAATATPLPMTSSIASQPRSSPG